MKLIEAVHYIARAPNIIDITLYFFFYVQREELVSHPLNCCVEGCATSSDIETTSTFYTVPVDNDKSLWTETFCIK